ncbi:hypothetical protein E2C01_010939 [Portunus trituberculatus]|uniref:Uncharacterized protein n=1 Tax=Portunus trituberculatus TaxID=210409 RepID=A0A5B7DA80_PORTR|nr:hypothetical protein [Portunus trituberculatus]
MFVRFLKMHRCVAIRTRFPNPVYHNTTGIEEDRSVCTIEQDGITFVLQEYDYRIQYSTNTKEVREVSRVSVQYIRLLLPV